jgi:hypothetical protein
MFHGTLEQPRQITHVQKEQEKKLPLLQIFFLDQNCGDKDDSVWRSAKPASANRIQNVYRSNCFSLAATEIHRPQITSDPCTKRGWEFFLKRQNDVVNVPSRVRSNEIAAFQQ